jgi:hypothetical protein
LTREVTALESSTYVAVSAEQNDAMPCSLVAVARRVLRLSSGIETISPAAENCELGPTAIGTPGRRGGRFQWIR